MRLWAASLRSTCSSATIAVSQPRDRRDLQAQKRDHPLVTGHPIVERVLLGTHPDAQEDVGIAPHRLSENPHRAFARFQLSGDQLQQRRLARAIRSQQAGDAATDVIVTSLSPITCPYHFERWSVRTTSTWALPSALCSCALGSLLSALYRSALCPLLYQRLGVT